MISAIFEQFVEASPFRGMMIALPIPLWQPWTELTLESFADTLKQWASQS